MKTIALGALLLAAGGTQAATFNFVAVTNDSMISSQIVSTVTVTNNLNNTVSFTILNGSSGVTTAFYIETGLAMTGLSNATIGNSAPQVDFNDVTGGPPGQSNPGGAVSSWNGSFFAMVAAPPATPLPNGSGLHSGESVTVVFNRTANFDFAALLASIGSGETRLAQHYQSWGTNGQFSEWLVAVVPIPPAAWAGLATLGVLGGLRAAKRRQG